MAFMEGVKSAVVGDDKPVSVKRTTKTESYFVSNLLISLIVALVFVAIDLFAIFGFGLGAVNDILIVAISMVLFLGLVLFLNSYSDRVTRKEERVFRQQPVTMYIPKGNDGIANEIMDEVTKSAKEAKDVEIAHYDYIGSSQTRTYHLRTCRLAKLIKPKFKLSNNSTLFFKKRKFKACKICIRKLRKT